MKEYRIRDGKKFRIGNFDPNDTSLLPGGKTEAEEKAQEITAELDDLQEVMYAEHKHRLLVVLQGMDTSGKDGTIRHVMTAFNPQGVQVVSFKKPTAVELAHDFLWRVHPYTPGAGEITIFNRSHYEDVLVVRVHELVSKKLWHERYRHIIEFERLLVEHNTTILKFFLHISADEQRKRLRERLEVPEKRWKFAVGDIQERKLWDDYTEAYEDAIRRTATKWAPWYIVPANAKWYRNYIVASVVRDTLRRLKMKYPMPDVSNIVIE
ncbi:MAG: polyphosphate kinase 2 family protein [Thermoanaerobaculia bacterium]